MNILPYNNIQDFTLQQSDDIYDIPHEPDYRESRGAGIQMKRYVKINKSEPGKGIVSKLLDMRSKCYRPRPDEAK